MQGGGRFQYLPKSGGVCAPNPELLYSATHLIDSIKLPERKPWQNKNVLHQKYIVEGASLAQIASEFLCSKNGVRAALIRFEIPLRERQGKGRSSNVDYGKRLVQGRRIEHMAEQRVIRTIVDMRNDGLSFQRIADFLSKIGVPTKKKGKSWHCEVVRIIYLRAVGTESKGRSAPVTDTLGRPVLPAMEEEE